MIWWWTRPEDKYVTKRKKGVTLYTKPKNEQTKQFKKKIMNRRLQTKRVETHTKK